MNRRVWILVFLLSVSFNIATLGVVAFSLRSRAQDQSGGPEGEVRQELQLSAAQQETFDRLRETFQQQRARQDTGMTALREALVRELVADQPDAARIDSLLDQMARGQAQVQRSLVDRILQETAVLRPEQRIVFAPWLERRLLRGGRTGDGAGRGARGSFTR